MEWKPSADVSDPDFGHNRDSAHHFDTHVVINAACNVYSINSHVMSGSRCLWERKPLVGLMAPEQYS